MHSDYPTRDPFLETPKTLKNLKAPKTLTTPKNADVIIGQLQEDVAVITKAMERLVRDMGNLKMDNDKLYTEVQNLKRENVEIKELFQEELRDVRQTVAAATNQLDLVSYESRHAEHLDEYMQEAKDQPAIETILSKSELSKQMEDYKEKRRHYGMDPF